MKNITLLIVLLFALTFSAVSQTTITEYNYLTKGYKIQDESGLDMKKGYFFVDITKHYVGARHTKFRALYKKGQNTPVAILCIYERTDNGYKEYLCIPHYDSSKEVWVMALNNLQKNYSKDAIIAYNWGVMHLATYYARNNNNTDTENLKIKRLKAENSKLRNRVAKLKELEEENSKLKDKIIKLQEKIYRLKR